MNIDLTDCPPNVVALEDLNLADLRGRDASRDVVVIALSPIENHGTHLPVGTDIYISRELAKRTACRFAAVEPDARVLLNPVIPLASAAIRGTGSVKITSRQVRAMLTTLCRWFMRRGYRRFVFISGHGGVPFVGALDRVCRTLNARGARAIAPCARVAGHAYQGAYIERLRARGVAIPDDARELFEQDLHAGFMETSLMLAIAPHLVTGELAAVPRRYAPHRPWLAAIRRGLVALARRLPIGDATKESIAAGARAGEVDLSWIIAGRLDGYLGDPARASAAFGEALLDTISDDLARFMIEVFHEGADPIDYRSSAHLFDALKWAGFALLVVCAALLFVSNC